MSAFDHAMRDLWHSKDVKEFFIRLSHMIALPTSRGTKGMLRFRRSDLAVIAFPELVETLDTVPSEGITMIETPSRCFMVRRTVEETFNYKKQILVSDDVWIFYSINGYFEI